MKEGIRLSSIPNEEVGSHTRGKDNPAYKLVLFICPVNDGVSVWIVIVVVTVIGCVLSFIIVHMMRMVVFIVQHMISLRYA